MLRRGGGKKLEGCGYFISATAERRGLRKLLASVNHAGHTLWCVADYAVLLLVHCPAAKNDPIETPFQQSCPKLQRTSYPFASKTAPRPLVTTGSQDKQRRSKGELERRVAQVAEPRGG